MTAPLFHLQPGALDTAAPGSVLTLEGAEGHHAATVMRLDEGEHIQLADTVATKAEGLIQAVAPGRLEVQILKVSTEPTPRPRLVLVQALAKDRRDLQAVESATELGVDAIIPWHAERSVARWKLGREAKKHAEWVNTVTTAAKQTRRTAIPEVRPLHTTAQYLAEYCGEFAAEKPTDSGQVPPQTRHKTQGGGDASGVGVVVLHEADEVSLHSVLDDLGALLPDSRLEELHLVVGPEGGISDRELAQFRQASARTARLGAHVLRSSTAGPAAIAGTQLLLGRWAWP